MNRFIYFIKPVGMPGPIKIGCSIIPAKRLMELSVWSPFELELVATALGGLDLERNIHDCFADAHSHREWFHPVPRLLKAIEQIKAGVGIADAIDLDAREGSIRAKARRTPWSAGRRQYMSFTLRAHAAQRRANRLEGRRDLRLPEHIWAIIHRWARNRETYTPTDADLAQLEALVADPVAHCVPANLLYAKRAAA